MSKEHFAAVEAAAAEVEAADKVCDAARDALQNNTRDQIGRVAGDRSPEQQACAAADHRWRQATAELKRVQDLAEHAPTDTERRKALAEAIDNAKAAENAVTAGRTAVRRAADNLEAAERELAAAASAVADAKTGHACSVEQAAKSGGTAQAGAALRTARARETDAQDDVEATRAAHANLAAQLLELEEDSKRAASTVETAADSVLSLALDALVAEGELMRDRLEQQRDVIVYLSRGAIDQVSADVAQQFLQKRPREVDVDHRATEPWRAARAALLHDADAPLPGAVPARGVK